MVAVATTLAGFYAAQSVNKRIALLDCCIMLIRTINVSIGYSGESLEEIIKKSSENSELKKLSFLKDVALQMQTDFYSVWRKNVELFSLRSPLRKGDTDLLISFGEKLGTTDISYQTQLCDEYIELFEDRRKAAESKKKEQIKLYKISGVVCAVAEIILML